MVIRFLFLILIIIGLSFTQAFAQDKTDSESRDLKEESEVLDAGDVEVIGKYGSITTVLPSQTIWQIGLNTKDLTENISYNSIARKCELAPGVTVKYYGGLGMPTGIGLRGAAGNQTLILSDGLPINTPIGASVDFSMFDGANYNKVEVIPGASGAMYGDSAIGGVINLIKSSPTESKRLFSMSTGSFGERNASLIYQSNKSRLPYLIQITHQGWDGDFKYETINHQSRTRVNSEYNRTGINLQLFDETDSNQVSKYSLMFVKGEGGSPGRAEYEDQNASKEDATLLFTFNNERIYSDQSRLKLGSLLQYQKLNYNSPHPPIGMPVDTHQEDFGTSIVAEYLQPNGIQVRSLIRWDQARSSDWSDPNRLNFNIGTSYLWQVTDRFSVMPALGLNYVDDNDVLLSPSIGITYAFNSDWTIKANYACASRYPSFPELYTPDDGTLVGNPDLDSEHISTLDAAIQYKTERVNLYISTFYSELENAIQFLPVSFFRVKAMNLPTADIKGTEMGIQYELSNEWSLASSATWLDAQYSTGGRLPARPRFRASSSLVYAKPSFNGSLILQHSTRMPLDFSGNLQSPDFTTIACELGIKLNKRINLTVSGDNLTNAVRRDAFDFPLPGRAFKLGLTFNF